MNTRLLKNTAGTPLAPIQPPQILIPYRPEEAWTVKQAAAFAKKSEATVRAWASKYDLGRRVGPGGWQLSKVALSMFLDGNQAALRSYHNGDRGSAAVALYFERHGLASLLAKGAR